MIVEELLTKLGFSVESKPLDAVNEKLEGIQRRLEFLGAVEVIKGVAELTERFGEFAERLGMSAAAAGITVESLQKLQFAAGQSGVKADEVASAMTHLTRSLYAARSGGKEAQQSFGKLGITPGQIASFHNSQEALAAISDRIKAVQDPIERQALALRLMGRGSSSMVEFLSKGSASAAEFGKEAEKIGAVISGETVESLRSAMDALSAFWQVIRAAAATIAADFAPSVKSAVHAVLEFWGANRKFIEINIKKWVYDFTFALGFLYGVFKVIIQKVLDFAQAHEEIVSWVGKAVVALMGIVVAVLFVQKVMGGLQSVLGAVAGAFKFLASPAVIAGAAIAGIVLAIQALYEMLFNDKSFEDTWLGKMLDKVGLGKDSKIGKYLGGGGIGDAIGKAFYGDEGQAAPESAQAKINAPQRDAPSRLAEDESPSLGDKLTKMLDVGASLKALNDKQQALPSGLEMRGMSAEDAQKGAEGVQNYQVNAPITVNVPPGTHPHEVAKKVKEAVKEHLGQVQRETHRGLRNAQAY